ncbi:MAG: glycosyltransferase family 39 protein [Actinobacteria bacterium]|nr:glycosyltransferase family 39 protein [Actinomycetota bacterium]
MSWGTTRRVGTRHGGSRADQAPLWSRLSWEAWAAVGVTALFIAITCWWLAADDGMPYGDAAEHLYNAFYFHDQLAHGDLLGPFSYRSVYPPLTSFVGGLAIFFGPRTTATPIVAQNLLYASLLAFGCYRVAQLSYGALAGLLAVVFALGSPLIAEQFHVFMLDPPEAALVAVTAWLLLSSERLRRVDLAAAAGLVTGLGIVTKQTFPLYVAGLLAVLLLRERGWRNGRGLGAYLLVALVVAAPWFLAHAGELGAIARNASANGTVPPLARPPVVSLENLEWYGWALANSTLFLPLLLFALTGVVWAVVDVVRRTRPLGWTPELLGGLGLAWVAITLMPHHDLRYTIPLVPYLAVLGTAWIPRLAVPWRHAAIGCLAAATVAATLGATFGVGSKRPEPLPAVQEAPDGVGVPPLHTLTLQAGSNYMVSGPRHGDDVLPLLKALRADGVTEVLWIPQQAPPWSRDFNIRGLLAYARVARLHVHSGAIDLSHLEAREALLLRGRGRRYAGAPACERLPDGTGVWVQVGGQTVCPRHR